MGGLLAGGIGLLAGCGPGHKPAPAVEMEGIGWVPLPSPSSSAAKLRVARTETTLGQWVRFLEDTGHVWPGSDHISRDKDGEWRIKPGHANHPVSRVSRADAEGYCAWLSRRLEGTVRLPSDQEWETAARGGLEGTRFPWGWEPARGRAVFDADAAQPVGSGAASRLGLADMAGNVWEWVATADGRGEARGGAWSERDEHRLECAHRQSFPPDYRDDDVGFRPLWETP